MQYAGIDMKVFVSPPWGQTEVCIESCFHPPKIRSELQKKSQLWEIKSQLGEDSQLAISILAPLAILAVLKNDSKCENEE